MVSSIMSPGIPLTNFVPKSVKNVVFVSDAKQVDDSKKNAKFIGASFCPWSQLGAAQFAAACDDLKEEKCYLFDADNPNSKDAAQKLGVMPEGFPHHVIVAGKGKKAESGGMMKANELRDMMRSNGFKI